MILTVNRLKKLLKQKAYITGEFTFSSGQKSNFYFDFKRAASDPEILSLIGQIFLARLQALHKPIDAVGGPMFGATPIATSIAVMSHKQRNPVQAFYIRKEKKEHGTTNYVEGNIQIDPYFNAVIVEDVVTTGASVLQAIENAKTEMNIEIQYVFALVDHKQGGREAIEKAGYKFCSLFTISDFHPQSS